MGYLWDHPLKQNNIRTLAHNTVLIDEKNQKMHGRGGKVNFFKSSPRVKVMEATSNAYDNARLYRRISALVDHGNGKNYAVDFFRVEGGDIQDYILHMPGLVYEEEGLSFENVTNQTLYDLNLVQKATGKENWKLCWPAGDGMECTVWGLGAKEENILVAQGWGQRDWKNSDVGAEILYLIRRNTGGGVKTFMSVVEGCRPGKSFVESVKVIDNRGIVEVKTAEGTDYIASAFDDGGEFLSYSTDRFDLRGLFSVVSLKDHKVNWEFAWTEK